MTRALLAAFGVALPLCMTAIFFACAWQSDHDRRAITHHTLSIR
jgi:hypothetical protein